MQKRIILRFGGFILYLLALAIGAEYCYRLLVPPFPRIPHAVLNHAWRPNYSFGNSGCTRRTNKQGWLEADDIDPKPPGEYRIFYLGDSFTEGNCDANVPDIVEAELKSKFPQKNIHVINAATPSYSPIVYLLQLKNYILPLKPDLIVLSVDMTDVFDDYLANLVAVRNSQNEIVAVPYNSYLKEQFLRTEFGLVRKSKLRGFLDDVNNDSELIQGALRAFDRFAAVTPKNQTGPDPYAWCHEPWSDETTKNVERTINQLTAIANLLAESNIALAVTAVPHKEQLFGENSAKPFDTIQAALAQTSAKSFDSFRALQLLIGNNSPESIYQPGDMHFNSDGYRLWAKVHVHAVMETLRN